MPTTRILPNGDLSSAGITRSTGTVNFSLVNDSSDTTFITFPGSGGGTLDQLLLDMGTFSLPSGAVVKSITPGARYNWVTAGFVNLPMGVHLTFGATVGGGLNWTKTTLAVAWPADIVTQPVGTTVTANSQDPFTTHWNTGGAWTQADIDGIQMVLRNGSANMFTGDDFKVYELYCDVLYANPPTVAVPTVTGTASSFPTVNWVYTLGTDGGPQSKYDVKIFDSATYSGGGFSPDTSTAVWSTTVSSSAAAQQIGTALVSGTTYQAYVRVYQFISGVYQPSVGGTGAGWQVSTPFTLALDQPAIPTLTVTADPTNARVQLVVQGHDNLLTEQDANLETAASVGTWVAVTNNTTTQSATFAIAPGAGSLRMSSTAAGDMESNTATGTAGVPVVAGRTYRIRASFRAGATTRSAKVGVRWYNAAGTIIGAAAYSGTVSATNAAFIEASSDQVAPALAAFASVSAYVVAPAAGAELFYIDEIAIQENAANAPATWFRGGFYAPNATAAKFYAIEYSDDAVNWFTVRGCGALTDPALANQLVATQFDYEFTPNVLRNYRARAYYTESGNTVNGLNTATGTATVDPTEWWLKDPLTPSLNLQIFVVDEGTMARPLPRGVFYPLGAPLAVVVKDTRKGAETTLILETTLNAERTSMLALLNANHTLLLQSPSALGPVNRYIEVGDASDVRTSQVGTLFWREWQLPYIEVVAP